jgi:hypothetical protein
LKHITKTTNAVCEKACDDNAKCVTYLFVDHGADSYCWIKNDVCPKLSATTHNEYHFYNKI